MFFEKFSGSDEACRLVVPAVLLLCLCGIPQVIETVGRKLSQIHMGVGRHLLHRSPATAELGRARAQGALGVDALLARNVDQGKEQVAKLHLALGRAGSLGLKLGTLLGNLVPHILDRLPLKAHGSRLARHLLGLHQRRQVRRHAVEQALERSLACRHGLILGSLLGKLDLVPDLEHLVGVIGIRIAKHMWVAADELGVDDGSHGLLERFNGLFRREWRTKEPESEKLYRTADERFIHVQRTEDGIDYTIYDARTQHALDGGQLELPDAPLSDAALEVCKLHMIGDGGSLRLADSALIEDLQVANVLPPLPEAEEVFPPLPELEQGYPMPDTGIGFLEMYQYGYTDGNAMLPLTKERAMELFMQDVPVFLLYADSTEAMALDAEDISSHTGVFGVEREEWDAVRGVVTLSEQADTEKLFLENPQDAFLIYQIRRGGELDAYRFMNYDYLQSKGVTPERGGYDAIYTGGFMDYGNARTNLDMIYQRFNVDHPADFKGRSLSVSDIVALKQNGVVSCHYVDSIGFRELPNFLKPENYLKNAEMSMEDDYGMIDGIINNGPKQPTVADLEAQVKAGFSISLTELAAASHREQKKPSVLEKLRERTPEQSKNKTAPKRSAEREL